MLRSRDLDQRIEIVSVDLDAFRTPEKGGNQAKQSEQDWKSRQFETCFARDVAFRRTCRFVPAGTPRRRTQTHGRRGGRERAVLAAGVVSERRPEVQDHHGRARMLTICFSVSQVPVLVWV
eukprot:scaffold102_cov340-Pavlova_lutheri.AAC.59